MKRNTLLLIVLFLALGGLSYWFIIAKNRNVGMSGNDWNFAVKDTASIGKIFIANRNGLSVTLERKNNSWLVNNKFNARQDAINNLLSVLYKVDLKARVQEKAIKTAVEEMSRYTIQVEVYDTHNKAMKKFYIGGVTSDEKGTFFMLEGSNTPYIMHLPNVEGGLRTYFFIPEFQWRDRTIFSYSPDDIKSVSVQYPFEKIKSFVLENSQGNYTVKPIDPATPVIQRPLKKGMVESFLIGLERQIAEGFENGVEGRDSISQLIPFAIIQITEKSGKSKTVKLHPRFDLDANGKFVQDEETGQSQVEKYYAEVDTDFFLVQHMLFKKVLWAYSYFYDGLPAK